MGYSSFDDLNTILRTLRAENGCPWDREQTPLSLLPYLIEESAELVEAVQAGDATHICEELGDVLLQVVFHATIAQENGDFTIEDVVRTICEKLVRRHPHVFASASAETPEAVSAQWDRIKAGEKGHSAPISLMDKVGSALPALTFSYEMEKRAAKAGFDWPDAEGAAAKIREELGELEEARAQLSPEAVEDEFGDLLLAMSNWGRKLGIHPELALVKANAKFQRRFRQMEICAGGSESLAKLDLAAQEALWQQVKTRE